MTATTERRCLIAKEDRALRAARVVALEAMPYFAHGLLAVTPVAVEGLGTYAVDRHWRLYVDPDTLTGSAAWAPERIASALLHESGHLLREHASRADAVARPLDTSMWNY